MRIDPFLLTLGRPTSSLRSLALDAKRACLRDDFVATRLGVGAFGLLVFLPAMLAAGGPAAGAIMLASSLAFIGAGILACRPDLVTSAVTVSAGASAALVALAAEGGGASAWPLALLLAADPAEALWRQRRRAAVYSAFTAIAVVAMLSLTEWLVSVRSGSVADLGTVLVTGFVVVRIVLASLNRPDRVQAPDAATSMFGAGSPLEAVYDLVTSHDAYGDVVEASEGAARLLGVSPSVLRGGGLVARVHVSDRPAFLKALSDAANGQDTVSVEFRLHAGPHARDAGSGEEPARRAEVVWAEMRALRLPSGAGGACVVAVTRDVSVHHQQTEDSERARRQAQQADEIKGRFLATVSHELRTPLNAIIGFSELLVVDHPFLLTEERRKEYATIIRSSGQHLLEIVNTLLDMSKIESGNFNFVPEPFDFRDLALGCCDLMRLKAAEAKVELRQRLDAELPEILADRRACRQILINLLSNAVKFTPAGGTITVALAREGDSIVLEVADTGIGIPEADLPRLGNPFFQSGEVHRRSHEGTGLGLSVVRGLVGLHRGELRIESGADVGTRVSVTLPIEGVRADKAPSAVGVQVLPRITALHLERKSA